MGDLADLRRQLRPFVPAVVRHWRLRQTKTKVRERYEGQSVEMTFGEIYQQNVWGGAEGEFYSGGGSDTGTAAIYANAVNKFIGDHHDIQVVVDLGCGDFRVGSMLTPDVSYIGVDIVAPLIRYNTEHYGGTTTLFRCINIIDDPLPAGELCLIRQVFQHLSNEQIVQILDKCLDYRYVIVTEHQPRTHRDIVPNIDKPAGPDTRLADRSGVFLDRAPFNWSIARTLCEVAAQDPPGIIRTFLFER